jgi:hypothetical protein
MTREALLPIPMLFSVGGNGQIETVPKREANFASTTLTSGRVAEHSSPHESRIVCLLAAIGTVLLFGEY